MTGDVLLVHGGLYEDMDAAAFWHAPGVVAGLAARGLRPLAPNRLRTPLTWNQDADALAAALQAVSPGPVGVVGGSNGCSAALRLAIDHRQLVSGLVLAWPATAGEPDVDARYRAVIETLADANTADRLLAGNTVRGVADAELRQLDVAVTIVPSLDETPVHRRRTVDGLLRLLPNGVAAAPTPPSPTVAFAEHVDDFVAIVAAALALDDDGEPS